MDLLILYMLISSGFGFGAVIFSLTRVVPIFFFCTAEEFTLHKNCLPLESLRRLAPKTVSTQTHNWVVNVCAVKGMWFVLYVKAGGWRSVKCLTYWRGLLKITEPLDTNDRKTWAPSLLPDVGFFLYQVIKTGLIAYGFTYKALYQGGCIFISNRRNGGG